MPDKAGAFLRASRIIARYEGNIVRVSYNKAVDLHMLFLDVEASAINLRKIENEMVNIGYLNDSIADTRVIEISVKIPDVSGAVLPVLEILSRYAVNISYLNSSAADSPYQNFKFGLLIEDTKLIKTLLDEIGQVYPIDIIDCDTSEEALDNTVFYIRLAREMQSLLGLNPEKTRVFLSESNRILQALQSTGEKADKVFDYIRSFALLVSSYRGKCFRADIEKTQLSSHTVMYSIQPYCGSNTYIIDTELESVILDSGYAIYADEMFEIFSTLIENFDTKPKRVYITHADVDHCGLLSKFRHAEIFLNQKSYNSLLQQVKGLPDYREGTELHHGYSKISRIISGYEPPPLDGIKVLDQNTPPEHKDLIKIGEMPAGDLVFSIYEGSGGHLYGEMVYACSEAGIIFTGDLLVNFNGFSKERTEFNMLAPYLMRTVNVDSKKARDMRKQVLQLAENMTKLNNRPCIICGGHGRLSSCEDGKLHNICEP